MNLYMYTHVHICASDKTRMAEALVNVCRTAALTYARRLSSKRSALALRVSGVAKLAAAAASPYGSFVAQEAPHRRGVAGRLSRVREQRLATHGG